MKIRLFKNFAIFFALSALLIACNDDDDEDQGPATSNTPTQREKVNSFFEAVNARDVATLEDLVTEDYIQHNPFIPTGRDAFVGLLTTVLEENGTKMENQRIIEEGNFIAAHNLWINAAPFGADTVVTFDILRFDENGKIAEHWDAIQPWESQTAIP